MAYKLIVLEARRKPPVCEKHESSTPVILTPSAMGTVDVWAPRVILCSTTDFRSP